MKTTGFATLDEYVNYLLHLALGKKSAPKEEELSREESEAVLKKLKALGYA